jgi:FAD/FMN-containing dehydrogenase
MVYDRYSGGPDLTGMFIGDGGSFGIKVEATYRMYKLMNTLKKIPWAYFAESWDKAWAMIQELSVVEPLPYYAIAFIPPTDLTAEMGMDQHLIMGGVKGSTEKEANAKMEIVDKFFKKHKAVVATGTQVDDWKQALMTGQRHREMGEFASMGTYTYFEYYMNRSQVRDCHHTMTKFAYDRLRKAGVEFKSNEGIVPSGSHTWIVSTIVWVPGEDKHAQKVVQEAFADATGMAVSHGWYPDCHQGWGTRMMAKYWPKHHYELMKRLKRALDPNNIMNPGIWDL